MWHEWRGQTFPAILAYGAASWPQRVALREGEEELTYAQLRASSLAAAERLRGLGIGGGDRVAYLMGVGREWVETYFAVLELGATLVPLNLTWTSRELLQGLALTDAHALLVGDRHRGQRLLDRVEEVETELAAAAPSLRSVISLRGAEAAEVWAPARRQSRPAAGQGSAPGPGSQGLLLLTSGSTSFPKPAVHTHESMLAGIASYADGLEASERDVFVHTTPNYHVGGIITMCLPLLRGGSVRLQDWFDPAETMRLIEADRGTLLWGFETHFAMMRADPSYGRHDLSSVTRTMVAANPAAFDAIASMGFDHVGSLYGSTEYMGSQSFFPYRDRFDRERMKESNGRPGTAEIRIVDPDTGSVCEPEQPGEICVRGPALFKGYHGLPEETAASFDEDGFFHSGDLGWVDPEGYLYYRGRYKEMIKSGGENVSAPEVEGFIAANVTGIARVVVCGVPDSKWGEAVTALIEPEQSATVDEREVIDACRGQLAGYKTPKRVIAVKGEDWVITPTGKLDRKAARGLAIESLQDIVEQEEQP